MKDHQHVAATPGPWRVSSADDDTVVVTHGTGEATVASCFDAGGFHSTRRANASLIAATPDLLAALEQFLDLCPRMSEDDPIAPALADACVAARQVIERAKGAA